MALRDEILEVSKDLLIEDGFGKMSMRKIAKRANVTATSIYIHFKNKDDLLLALIEESIENLKQSLIAEADSSKGLAGQLRDIGRAYIRFALDHPKEYEIIYMVRPEEMPSYPKEKFKQVRSGYELIAGIIKEGKEKEQFDVDDPLITAYSMWAQIHGVVSVILNKRIDTRISQKQFINQALEHILQGFITQKKPA
jgi:AcrR family transcriptional regulator